MFSQTKVLDTAWLDVLTIARSYRTFNLLSEGDLRSNIFFYNI